MFRLGSLIFRNVLRNRRRSLLTLGSAAVSLAVLGFLVALYQGYETQATPEGVAHATTRTVVIASLGVLAMDFVLTALMFSTP